MSGQRNEDEEPSRAPVGTKKCSRRSHTSVYEQGAPGCAGRFVKHYGTDRSRYSLLRHQDFAGLPRRHVAPARSREEASVVHAGRRIDLRHLRERRDGLKKSERYCCCERHSGREPSRLSRRDLSTVRALTISRPPSQQRAPQRDPPRDASSAASREGTRHYQIPPPTNHTEGVNRDEQRV